MPTSRFAFSDLNLRFSVGGMEFDVLNLANERFERVLPSHSHSNRSYELHYIASGHGYITLDHLPYEVAPGTLYVTGPLIEHSQTPDPTDPMVEYCTYLKLVRHHGKPQHTKSLSLFADTVCWFGTDCKQLEPLFLQIFDELEQRHTAYLEQLQALLQQLIIRMIRIYETPSSSIAQTKSTNLGEQNYLALEECFLFEYPDLTLQKLANRLGLSVRQTERVLRRQYGKTFQQKKAEAQMSAAAIFLRDPAMRIAQIAERLGYSSGEHFSVAFKRYYGCSATTYRKRHKIV